ncbi:XRE family transcriptional regulator [Burkholderia cepacia]|nr:XRE family transcriptional regulator [Burkholderia cepacia]
MSYLSMLENNKRDPTLSTIMKIAEALQVPVGVMFFLASEKEELGQIDEDTVKAIERAALASLQSQVEAAHE